MNRKAIIGIIACLVIIGALLWVFDSPVADVFRGKKRVVSSRWAAEYGIRSSDPRGLAFFNDLLKTHTGDSVYTLDRWSQLDSIPGIDSATYLFIGEHFGMEDSQFDSLVRLTDSGATLFLAFDYVTSNIYERYFEPGAYYWEYSNKLFVALGDTTLPYYSVFQNDTIFTDWYTFDPRAIIDTNHRAFAWAMNFPIAFESVTGKGKTVMHSVPRLFTNYQLLGVNGFSHAELMLRRIPVGKPVIWLEYGRIASGETENPDDEKTGNGGKKDNSYLQFIMKHEALRWALLLAICVFLLYVVFRTKRREAVLPGVPGKRNMSLAFVETLSSIYLSRNSPYGIMLVLRKNFYMAVNRHFYIDLLNGKDREEDIKRLVEKSSVDETELRKYLDLLNTNKANRIDEQVLGEIYRFIRQFYLQTGIARSRKQFVVTGQEIQLHRSLIMSGTITLLGSITFVRGLYLLSLGTGSGILLMPLSIVLLYLSARLFSLPVAKITNDHLVVYGLLAGKKQLDLSEAISRASTKSGTVFYTESGKQVSVRHAFLSPAGRTALNLFIQHIKQKTA